jgi:DNA primase
MFKVNNNAILTEDILVLQELKEQLALNKIERFKDIKEGHSNIQVTCPFHSDGQERKPSCGIATRGDKAGVVHCFTCGYTSTLEEMISKCFGYNDFGAFGKEWLIKNFLTVSVEERKALNLNLNREISSVTPQYVTEEELDTYRYYHPYMRKRKLTDEVIEKFDVGFDKKTNCLTFPMRDINGNTLFLVRRNVSYKFFSYPPDVQKPVYGIYEIDNDVDEIIVCESIINALTCFAHGKTAVALLGLGTNYQMEQLKQLKQRKIILALDGDEAGERASLRIRNCLKNKIVSKILLPTGKDINDLEKEQFEYLYQQQIYF